ncbi:hypothetical protein ACFVFJ_44740 [Streptomyces sp. NPDC057717]|uniref:hypothetical protein n=1 Tax=Streptomyces sp. NPDC057717 TaxID=3346224 RepID=UPI0036A5F21C
MQLADAESLLGVLVERDHDALTDQPGRVNRLVLVRASTDTGAVQAAQSLSRLCEAEFIAEIPFGVSTRERVGSFLYDRYWFRIC